MNLVENRYKWVDVLKFLGMFAVYLGHFAQAAGNSYTFVFIYHVPLFFFVSGFFAISNKKVRFLEFVKKKVATLLVPYYIFTLLYIVVGAIHTNSGVANLKSLIIPSLKGIRNNIFAYNLWFLPCLFVVVIIFDICIRLFKNKFIVLAISLVLCYTSATMLPNKMPDNPQWFFNIDSAMYYIIFYALGAVLFNYIKDLQFNKLNILYKSIASVSFVIALLITVKSYFNNSFGYNLGASIGLGPAIRPVVVALIIIYVNIIFSHLLSKFDLLGALGKNSLMLCGNELIVKTLVPALLGVFGLQSQLANPLQIYIYTFILMVVVNYALIPFERRLFPYIFKN